jgi:hypothetical protein
VVGAHAAGDLLDDAADFAVSPPSPPNGSPAWPRLTTPENCRVFGDVVAAAMVDCLVRHAAVT